MAIAPSCSPKVAIVRSRSAFAAASADQALGMWALASRWLKVALLYGASGLGYWLVLLTWGKSPSAMLQLMPAAAGSVFGLLFVSWLVAMRISHPGSPDRIPPGWPDSICAR